MDVGDRVEVAKLPEDVDYGLSLGQQGKVVAVCDGYCLWIKFDRFNPAKQPSTKFGFALYFDEVRPLKSDGIERQNPDFRTHSDLSSDLQGVPRG